MEKKFRTLDPCPAKVCVATCTKILYQVPIFLIYILYQFKANRPVTF